MAVMHMIDTDGCYTSTRIGPPVRADSYVCVLPADAWFGATCEGDHVLVSAMMAPAFTFADYELADRESLLAAYPEHAEIIRMLTLGESDDHIVVCRGHSQCSSLYPL